MTHQWTAIHVQPEDSLEVRVQLYHPPRCVLTIRHKIESYAVIFLPSPPQIRQLAADLLANADTFEKEQLDEKEQA